MNTRQKLTLGIAAIFMVTLTIVGVTYAYFVTRVEGLDNEVDATVTTATLTSVEYAEGNDKVTIASALPGEKVYKTFKVVNKNTETGAQYDVTLAASDGSVEFIHTDNDSTCYPDEDNLLDTEAEITAYIAAHTECYKDTATVEGTTTTYSYNNVKYHLHRVTEDLSEQQKTDFNDLDDAAIKTLLGTNAADQTGLVQQGTTKAAPQTLAASEVIEAGATEYYVLVIEYANVDANQNIENLAELNMFVSIK